MGPCRVVLAFYTHFAFYVFLCIPFVMREHTTGFLYTHERVSVLCAPLTVSDSLTNSVELQAMYFPFPCWSRSPPLCLPFPLSAWAFIHGAWLQRRVIPV